MSVLAKDRKEKPFRCQQQAEVITGLLIDDVLEKFAMPLHYEQWDVQKGTYIVSEKLYPRYAVRFVRDRLMEKSAELLDAIAIGNSINPSTVPGAVRNAEIAERRVWQSRAIGYATAIQAQCNLLVSRFPSQMHRFKHYTTELDALIATLRKWKKYIPPARKNSDVPAGT